MEYTYGIYLHSQSVHIYKACQTPRPWMFPTTKIFSSLIFSSHLLIFAYSHSPIRMLALFALKPFQYIQMILPTIAQEIHIMIQ